MPTTTVLQTRHFNTIAEGLKLARMRSPHRHAQEEFDRFFLPAIVEHLAKTNPKFDAERFRDAVINSD